MKLVRSLLFIAVTAATPAFACDPCALYNASRLQGHASGSFTLAVSEQYTDFDRATGFEENSVRDGEYVRGFSTTQFSLAYDATDTFGVQLTLPMVGRKFDEVRGYRNNTESEMGIGDLSLAGTYSFLNYQSGDWSLLAGITGGIKFPTGDTGVLREVTQEEEHYDDRALLRHHTIGGATGGRALTFGTGSYDYIFGLNLLSRYQRYLLLSSVQYTLRTEGDFNYEFADDILWTFGPGYYLFLDDAFTAAGLVVLSGEFKGKDHLNNELVAGSDVSNLYVGPEILLTFHEKIGAEFGVDFRVTDEDRNATVVPELRMRGSVSYRF